MFSYSNFTPAFCNQQLKYAVGEVIGAGTTLGNAYVNGMFVTPATTFGRLLGERILSLS